MKKLMFIVLLCSFVSTLHASKLSAFLKKMDDDQKQKESQEIQQDMNFSDFVFKIQQRYVNDRGESCRDYDARSRTNPFRYARFIICDGR